MTADRRLTAYVYCAATDVNPDDIVVGEGHAMEFVAADKVPSLDLADNAAPALLDFLSSDQFRRLAVPAQPSRSSQSSRTLRE